MVNTYSPAHALFMAEPAPAAIRYPSPPPTLRWLRWQLGVLQSIAPALAEALAWRVLTTPRRLPALSWEAAALAGSAVSWVPRVGGRVATYAWGEADAPAVVLVHGWEHRASFWGAWVAPLRTAGFRVLALDGPAHGRTAGRRTNLLDYGQAVQAVVDSAGQTGPVHAVVAHSFGAASVVGLPLAAPAGHLTATLPRLVLLSTPLGPEALAARFAELLRLGPPLMARMKARMQKIIGRDVAELAVPVAGPRLPVDHTLLLHDEHDSIMPVGEAHLIAAAWPAARLLLTSGLGHNRILREPAVVRQVVNFLR